MLQQTQVERVIRFYKNFIKQFPTAKKLTEAPLADVLKAWQGLGYNRRAKMLRAAVKGLAGREKISVSELEKLPGVGPYTARAVVAFAYNEDVIFIETNIRTAIIHYFFAHKKKVSDTEIEKILIQLLPKGKSREWYSALMDYGAYLKKSGIKLNAQHANYTKQKKFAGSRREARGAILRALAIKSQQGEALLNLLGISRRTQLRSALAALQKEGLIEKRDKKYSLQN
jgi:A/G-specific adenine glycosylase